MGTEVQLSVWVSGGLKMIPVEIKGFVFIAKTPKWMVPGPCEDMMKIRRGLPILQLFGAGPCVMEPCNVQALTKVFFSLGGFTGPGNGPHSKGDQVS